MHHAYIDKFAYQDSPVHRLDSRGKLIVVLVFTALVISLPRYSPAILVLYAVGPFALLVWGKVPLRFVFRHSLLVSGFVVVLALTCPFYDRRQIMVTFGPFAWQSTLGWMRCYTIVAKFIVTMMALIGLVSTTKFSDLLVGLQRLGVPKILVIQLGFLYRYIFILIDKVQHMLLARAGRRLRNLGFRRELSVASSMIGSLLIRSIDSAERVSMAMEGRGFDGSWPTAGRSKLGGRDYIFVLASAGFMLALHLVVRPVFS